MDEGHSNETTAYSHTLVLVKWLKVIFIKLSKPEIGLKHRVLPKVRHYIENASKPVKK